MISEQTHKSNLISSINAVVVINLVLAVVSFFKDIVFASYFGTNEFSDALLLAFFIPDTVGNGLIGAAAGVAAVPVLSVLVAKQDYIGFKKCLKGVQVFMILFCTVIMVLLYIFSGQVIKVLGAGFTEEFLRLSEKLLYILLPSMLIFAYISIGNSTMQVLGRFKTASFTTVLYNAVFLFGIAVIWIVKVPVEKGVYGVSFSIILGVISMLLFVIYHTGKLKNKFFPDNKVESQNNISENSLYYLKRILWMFFPFLSIGLCTQIVLAYERFMASSLGPGSIAGLNYAYRLAQFPTWVFIFAISTVILPAMAMDNGMGRHEGLNDTLEKAIRMIILGAIPMTLALNILRVPIITVLFKRGAFNDTSVEITSAVLAGYSLTIVTLGLVNVCTRAFLARSTITKPLIVFAISAAVNIVSDVVLVRKLGVAGIGYGAALGALSGALVMIGFIKKEFGIHILHIFKRHTGVLLVNLVIAIIMFFCRILWYNFIYTENFIVSIAFLSIVFVFCGGVYYLGLKVCRYI